MAYNCSEQYPDCYDVITVDQPQNTGSGYLYYDDFNPGCCGNLVPDYAYAQGQTCPPGGAPQADARSQLGRQAAAYADRSEDLPSSPPIPDRAPRTIYVSSGCTGEYNAFLISTPST